MSVVDDYFPLVVAAFLGFVGSFALMIYKKRDDIFDKTRSQSTLTTVNVGNIQEQMKEIKKMNDDLKDYLDHRFDKMEQDNKSEFRRAFEKIDKMSTETYNLSWRVREIEDRFKRGSGGTGGGALM